jgi:type IV secretory pathway VirD2 relaxase
MSGSILKHVMPSTLHKAYENCEGVQVGTSKAWVLETIQYSDDTRIKDNIESASMSIDKEEKVNVSKCQH